MQLFGRHNARQDVANVTPRRRGWALFSPYPQMNRTNPNNPNTTTTRRTFKRRTNDATTVPARRSRRIGRANADARANGTQHVPLVTKVKRTLGIQSRGRRPVAVDTAVRPRGRGLFSSTPRIRERRVEPERNRGWFSGSSGRYRT